MAAQVFRLQLPKSARCLSETLQNPFQLEYPLLDLPSAVSIGRRIEFTQQTYAKEHNSS